MHEHQHMQKRKQYLQAVVQAAVAAVLRHKETMHEHQQMQNESRTFKQSVRLPRLQYSVTRQGGLVTVPISCTQLGCRRLNMMSACNQMERGGGTGNGRDRGCKWSGDWGVAG